MTYIEPGTYVRIQQLEGEHAPRPRPLQNGFREGVAYRVLSIYNPAETSEAWLGLRNDRNELWFISNRHVRIVDRDDVAYSYALDDSMGLTD